MQILYSETVLVELRRSLVVYIQHFTTLRSHKWCGCTKCWLTWGLPKKVNIQCNAMVTRVEGMTQR